MPARSSTRGFAVAGGRSRRMGEDKALLAWGKATLLDHALARLREVCGEVTILAGPQARYQDRGLPVVTDLVPEGGALGGVYSGLAGLDEVSGLFLAVDLPLVPTTLLQRLIDLSRGHDAVVPVSLQGPEPLCAVYGPGCREPMRRCLEAGRFKMTSFWPEVRVRRVEANEIAAFGDPSLLFANVNTPAEYRDRRRDASRSG